MEIRRADMARHSGGGTETLALVADAVRHQIGTVFLQRVATALRSAMAADFVFITLGDGEPARRAEAVLALEDGEQAELFEYDLFGTPCQFVYGGETLIVPEAVAERFPAEEGFEGYAGTPLRNAEGEVVGHFAVLSRSVLREPKEVQAILRIVATRVEAELRHRTDGRERERLIADLVALNDRSRKRTQSLHDANQFKTRLLGIIAHDLRRPLAAIIAQAELARTRLLRSPPSPDGAVAGMDKVIAAADRMSGLITKTLMQVREEMTDLEPVRSSTDVAALARVAMEANLHGAERKSIRMILAPADKIVASLDEELALEAIDNLVSNAVKYTQPGGEVRISVEERDGSAHIAVADNGPGLTEDDRIRVFGQFQTLSAKPTGGETATGLGLANVREIVSAHGGEVLATSDGPGHGAAFRLVFPLGTP